MKHARAEVSLFLLISFVSFLLVLFSTRATASVSDSDASPDESWAATDEAINVVIIGGGIGGAATAYYTRQATVNLTQPINIHVFEATSTIGGRIQETVIDGVLVEVGADAYADCNTYLKQLVHELGLPVDNSINNKYSKYAFLNSRYLKDGINFDVFNGTKFINITNVLINEFSSDLLLYGKLQQFLKDLATNYETRDQHVFDTITEFLSAGNLNQYTKISGYDFLTAAGISPSLSLNVVEPVQHTIFDQTLDMAHTFATMTSLASLLSAYTVTTGNRQIVSAMFNKSNTHVHTNSQVSSVSMNCNSTYEIKYSPTYIDKQGNMVVDSSTVHFFNADVIVLAAPYEVANISFSGIKPITMPFRKFVSWYVTFIVASGLNGAYFGFPSSSILPETILTTREAWKRVPFNDIQYRGPSNSGHLYKLFSETDISSFVEKIFVNITTTYVHHWPYTFPHLTPIEEEANYQPIHLASNMYYVNSMESVASAMEGSTIAGRNVGLLIAKSISNRQKIAKSGQPCQQ